MRPPVAVYRTQAGAARYAARLLAEYPDLLRRADPAPCGNGFAVRIVTAFGVAALALRKGKRGAFGYVPL